ncbi:MAG: hypothetical protein R2798_07830 [Chitinophagales bacterium]
MTAIVVMAVETRRLSMYPGCNGTPPVDPGCNDGDCSNGVETWDGCQWDSNGTPPVDPGCNDGDCSNGVETANGTACQCIRHTARRSWL